MEKEKEKAKKTVPAAAVAAQKKPKGSLKDYFKGIKTEMKKGSMAYQKRTGFLYRSRTVCLCCFRTGNLAVDSAFLASLKYVLNISF